MIPEHALLYAILERAVVDASYEFHEFTGQNWRNLRDSMRTEEALDWLFNWGSADASEPFTFPWIYHHLGLEPEEAADRIKATLKSGVRHQRKSVVTLRRLRSLAGLTTGSGDLVYFQ